jgi:hypothetical protein
LDGSQEVGPILVLVQRQLVEDNMVE